MQISQVLSRYFHPAQIVGLALSIALAGPALGGPVSPSTAEVPVFLTLEAPAEGLKTHASQSSPVSVDERLIASNPDRIRLSLPDGSERVAERRAFEESVEGPTTWRGAFEGSEGETILLTVTHSGVSGHFSAGGAHYRLLTDGSAHRLERIALPRTKGYGASAPHQGSCAVEGSLSGYSFLQGLAESKAASDRGACSASISQIDVLAVYVPGMNGKAVDQRATAEILEANEIFERSQVPVRYRLVNTVQLGSSPDFSPYDPSRCTDGSLSGCAVTLALDWLNSEPGEILSLRAQRRADMVLMYIPPFADFPCGKANLPTQGELIIGPSGGDEPFDQRAFAVAELGCGLDDFTVPHELGHVLSLEHFETDRSTLFDFASGHIFPMILDTQTGGAIGQQRRVNSFMACRDDERDDDPDVPGLCDRVPFASNPEVTVDSLKGPVPTGVPGSRDNALVACRRGPVLAAFQRSTGNGVPTLRIREPAPTGASQVFAGESLRLRAEAFDAEDSTAFLASRITWRSDQEGFLGTGGTIDVTLETLADHLITARVVDSFGHAVERSVSVAVPSYRPDPYEDGDFCGNFIRSVAIGLDEADHTFHRPGDRDAFFLQVPEATRVRIRAESLRRTVDPLIVRYESFRCNQVVDTSSGVVELDLPAGGTAFAITGADGLVGPDTLYRLTIEEVIAPPPTASFTASCTTLRCTLDASASTGSNLTYSWSFGDGSTATGRIVQHIYPRFSSFLPRLTVRDGSGRQAAITRMVTLSESFVAPRVGSWYNPQRSGNGFDLMRNNSGQYALAWFTYDTAGNPTWYISETGPKSSGATFAQPLYRATWNGFTAQLTIVGSVQLRFADSTTAVFDWSLDGQSGREVFRFLAGNGGHTGAWYSPAESGWGLFLSDTGSSLVTTVAFYDGAGRARWVQGTTTSGSGARTVAMRAFSGPGLCPSCGGGTSSPPPSTAAGTVDLSLSSGSPQLWIRSQITGAAGSWTRPWTRFDRLTLAN